MDEKTHLNFFTFTAKDNFELGFIIGKKFGEFARKSIEQKSKDPDWATELARAKKYLDITEKYFPNYVDELRGYAKGANADFVSLWTLSLEGETERLLMEKCTTIITNGAKLISHNEDWQKGSENSICLLLKKIGNISILELYYLDTLGGNAISLNSNGFMSTNNTLTHDNKKFGIPRDVMVRYLSETKDPENDFLKLQNLPRSMGFNLNIINREGKIWNIECNSEEATLNRPIAPYVHTNHYLHELKSFEMDDNSHGSFDRYEMAKSKVKPQMSIQELMDLSGDKSKGEKVSIMNERTIARMIIDLENSVAKVWLKRETDQGWIDYKLDKLLKW